MPPPYTALNPPPPPPYPPIPISIPVPPSASTSTSPPLRSSLRTYRAYRPLTPLNQRTSSPSPFHHLQARVHPLRSSPPTKDQHQYPPSPRGTSPVTSPTVAGGYGGMSAGGSGNGGGIGSRSVFGTPTRSSGLHSHFDHERVRYRDHYSHSHLTSNSHSNETETEYKPERERKRQFRGRPQPPLPSRPLRDLLDAPDACEPAFLLRLARGALRERKGELRDLRGVGERAWGVFVRVRRGSIIGEGQEEEEEEEEVKVKKEGEGDEDALRERGGGGVDDIFDDGVSGENTDMDMDEFGRDVRRESGDSGFWAQGRQGRGDGDVDMDGFYQSDHYRHHQDHHGHSLREPAYSRENHVRGGYGGGGYGGGGYGGGGYAGEDYASYNQNRSDRYDHDHDRQYHPRDSHGSEHEEVAMQASRLRHRVEYEWRQAREDVRRVEFQVVVFEGHIEHLTSLLLEKGIVLSPSPPPTPPLLPSRSPSLSALSSLSPTPTPIPTPEHTGRDSAGRIEAEHSKTTATGAAKISTIAGQEMEYEIDDEYDDHEKSGAVHGVEEPSEQDQDETEGDITDASGNTAAKGIGFAM